MSKKIAWFITPHGFGHAARCAAVMDRMAHLEPGIQFEIFTKVPPWFFSDSMGSPFNYHDWLTDIGMVQRNPLKESVTDTVIRLDSFFPFKDEIITHLANQIHRSGCQLVVSDIAAMGIAVAEKAGIPSVLLENFTWDWIYQQYDDVRLDRHVRYLAQLYLRADYRIRAEPLCGHMDADLFAPPISRIPRTPPQQLRKRLHIPDHHKVVLITMGGFNSHYQLPDGFTRLTDISFIIPGNCQHLIRQGNLIQLPRRSQFYHPDLIQTADAVVGKVGYSTLAEVYHAGVPFGYVTRDSFPESNWLIQYVKAHMPGVEINITQFNEGKWMEHIQDLISIPIFPAKRPNGARSVAEFICQLIP